jgi:hypothetical protein
MSTPLLKLPIAFIFILSCSPADAPVKGESDIDAAREFVRSALDGDYRKASYYLLKDSTNDLLFEQQQTNYKTLSPDDRRNYRESTIRPVDGIQRPNDSTTIFRYYHTANPTDTTSLRIVKREGRWLVDLKSVIKM